MLIEEMQAYYEKRAREYDISMGYDTEDKARELEPAIKLTREILKGRRVLELACGPGYWTQQIAPFVRSVVATDYNESTLREARKKNLDSSRVTFEQADAYKLDQIVGDFDAVFAVDWFAHVPRSRISEFLGSVACRIPKGCPVFFLDQLPKEGSITEVFDSEGNHIQERILEDGSKYRVIKHFLDDSEIEGYLCDLDLEFDVTRMPECRRIALKWRTKFGEQDVPAKSDRSGG